MAAISAAALLAALPQLISATRTVVQLVRESKEIPPELEAALGPLEDRLWQTEAAVAAVRFRDVKEP
jgi:hypothetical protein